MKSTTCESDGLSRGTASDFIQERKYLKHVTPKTLACYEQSFKPFANALDSESLD